MLRLQIVKRDSWQRVRVHLRNRVLQRYEHDSRSSGIGHQLLRRTRIPPSTEKTRRQLRGDGTRRSELQLAH